MITIARVSILKYIVYHVSTMMLASVALCLSHQEFGLEHKILKYIGLIGGGAWLFLSVLSIIKVSIIGGRALYISNGKLKSPLNADININVDDILELGIRENSAEGIFHIYRQKVIFITKDIRVGITTNFTVENAQEIVARLRSYMKETGTGTFQLHERPAPTSPRA